MLHPIVFPVHSISSSWALTRSAYGSLLCYEVTDRNGQAGREAGLEENRRYLQKSRRQSTINLPRLSGAHASFTLDEDSLAAVVDLADEFDAGVHIHVAEDPCDEDACRREHQLSLIERLEPSPVCCGQSTFSPTAPLERRGGGRDNEAGLSLAHNPRSNMNNAVGYSPLAKLECPVMLGTDGIGSDMFAEARHAWFKSRDAQAGLAPPDILRMLVASARRASSALDITLGHSELVLRLTSL